MIPHPGRRPPDPCLLRLPQLVFASRRLQLPLYLGLIVAQGVYVWQFWVELVHLVQSTFGDSLSLQAVIETVTPPGGRRLQDAA